MVGTLVIGTLIAGVISIAISSVGATADPTTSLGFVISWAVQTGASTLATPIVAAVTTVLYLELRVRQEGSRSRRACAAARRGASPERPWPLAVPDEPAG